MWNVECGRNRFRRITCVSMMLALILSPVSSSFAVAEDFKRALPGRVFSFPQDHFSHPEFKTEWWYYSGHLQSRDQDKRVLWLSTHLFQDRLDKRNKGTEVEMVDSKPLFCSSCPHR